MDSNFRSFSGISAPGSVLSEEESLAFIYATRDYINALAGCVGEYLSGNPGSVVTSADVYSALSNGFDWSAFDTAQNTTDLKIVKLVSYIKAIEAFKSVPMISYIQDLMNKFKAE